jgi:hypothetical protein
LANLLFTSGRICGGRYNNASEQVGKPEKMRD